jgi:hypothetical protein
LGLVVAIADLALRNVLLGANNIVKVSDMGHARIMDQDIYRLPSVRAGEGALAC